jgi:hypothetical protein
MLRVAAAIALAWYALYFCSEKAIVLIFEPIDLDLWTRIATAVHGAS